MKIKFKVSVVVCTKNEEKRIVSCLKSISKNKVDEIILVDGNSSDNTVKLAKKFIDKVIISKKKSSKKTFYLARIFTQYNLYSLVY